VPYLSFEACSLRRNILCLHSIFFSREPALRRTETYCVRTASSRPTTAHSIIFDREAALRPTKTYCVCTASSAASHASSRKTACIYTTSSQPTTACFAAQKHPVLAQHLLQPEKPALRRTKTYCVRTASSSTARPRFLAQNGLVLHNVLSTNDSVLRRTETSCACTASSSAASPRFAARKRTVFAQHLLDQRQRASPHGNALCLHSIFFRREPGLQRAGAHCVCTVSFDRRERSSGSVPANRS